VSAALAVLFTLLTRHDPRPYLRAWAAAWLAQAIAAAILLAQLGGRASVGPGWALFLEALSGLLILGAALEYSRGWPAARVWGLSLLGAGCLAGAFVAGPSSPWLGRAPSLGIGLALVAAAATLWRLREPGGRGLRLTTNVLALLGMLHLLREGPLFLRTANLSPVAWSAHLFLHVLLGVGIAVAVLEGAQFALTTTGAQLKEAQQRLKTMAETDPLTGAFNRRVFRDLVDDLRAGQGVQEGVVILVDLDGVKEMNETKGHAAGDHAIRGVAEAIRSRTRDSDLLVRWGGDEFVVVIPGAGREEGDGRRDQIAAAIREAGLAASAGLAVYDARTDILAAVDEADRVAYEVKILRRAAPA
jgi:diguanylate cyclase (GGDEF)-like protein